MKRDPIAEALMELIQAGGQVDGLYLDSKGLDDTLKELQRRGYHLAKDCRSFVRSH